MKIRRVPCKCDNCGKSFKSKRDIIRHLRIHSRKGYKCKVCRKIFFRKHNLSLHTRVIHDVERPYKCNICGESFSRNLSLGSHVKHNHVNMQIFEKDVSEIPIAGPSDLNVDKLTKPVERPYKCSVCGESFTSNCSLSGHVEYYHTAIYIIEDDIFGVTLVGPSNTDVDLFTVSDERLYECNICKKSLSRHCSLGSYVDYSHIDVRSFENDISGIPSAGLNNLNVDTSTDPVSPT